MRHSARRRVSRGRRDRTVMGIPQCRMSNNGRFPMENRFAIVLNPHDRVSSPSPFRQVDPRGTAPGQLDAHEDTAISAPILLGAVHRSGAERSATAVKSLLFKFTASF